MLHQRALSVYVLMITACLLGSWTKNTASKMQTLASQMPSQPSTLLQKKEDNSAVAINARPNECGLQEQQGPEQSVGPFDISVKFFQPGAMLSSPGSNMHMKNYEDSQMHLEVDTKANAWGTNWGYSTDETPAGLQMWYSLTDASGKELAHDMMMEMNAIDGSHYGTNLPAKTIVEPGTYHLKMTIYPPRNYAIHQDYITGVPKKGWFAPMTADMEWILSREMLDKVDSLRREAPMTVPDNCKNYPVRMVKDDAAEKAYSQAIKLIPVPIGRH